MAKLLTKSKYMNGLESDALLWMVVNQKESLPEVDDATQAKFDAGKEIEILARKMFPGIDLSEADFKENLAETKKYISQNKIIYEAGFMIDNLYSRSDIIIPNSDGSWDLIEIKGSTKVKESHVKDLAFQKHVLELSGLKINDCFVIHLNRDYVRKDFLDIGLLFSKSDVTRRVNKEIVGIEQRIEHMFDVINLPQCPMFDYRDILKSEYGNYLIDEFYEDLPENSVFDLYNIEVERALNLLDRGILLISDLPDDFILTAVQKIQKDCIINDKVHIQKDDLKAFNGGLKFPICYLDVAAMMPAIPLFESSRAYDQIPYQYSLRIEHESGKVEHKNFLYDGSDDPRIFFLDNLKKDLEGAGSVVIYNEAFELYRLKALAKSFPNHSWLDGVLDNIVDLAFPFKSFAYYNPKQGGAVSLNKVMSLFFDKSHESLVIKNVDDASRLYYANFGNLNEVLKNDLVKCCDLNTEGMYFTFKSLRGLVSNT